MRRLRRAEGSAESCRVLVLRGAHAVWRRRTGPAGDTHLVTPSRDLCLWHTHESGSTVALVSGGVRCTGGQSRRPCPWWLSAWVWGQRLPSLLNAPPRSARIAAEHGSMSGPCRRGGPARSLCDCRTGGCWWPGAKPHLTGAARATPTSSIRPRTRGSRWPACIGTGARQPASFSTTELFSSWAEPVWSGGTSLEYMAGSLGTGGPQRSITHARTVGRGLHRCPRAGVHPFWNG